MTVAARGPRQDEQAALTGLRGALARADAAESGGTGKAYAHVADTLRGLVVSGALRHGDRLPTESTLAAEFGVSRATAREALRILAAEGLVVATKGAQGGTYVTRPSLDFAARLLKTNVALLADLDDITLDVLLEARRLIEVPAARLAARRRTDGNLVSLESSIPDDAGLRTAEARFASNAGFHTSLMAASGNPLLEVSALPIFAVLQTSLSRSRLGNGFDRRIDTEHREITDAIARGDEDGAEQAMAAHLDYLQPHYRRVWRRARGGRT